MGLGVIANAAAMSRDHGETDCFKQQLQTSRWHVNDLRPTRWLRVRRILNGACGYIYGIVSYFDSMSIASVTLWGGSLKQTLGNVWLDMCGTWVGDVVWCMWLAAFGDRDELSMTTLRVTKLKRRTEHAWAYRGTVTEWLNLVFVINFKKWIANEPQHHKCKWYNVTSLSMANNVEQIFKRFCFRFENWKHKWNLTDLPVFPIFFCFFNFCYVWLIVWFEPRGEDN